MSGIPELDLPGVIAILTTCVRDETNGTYFNKLHRRFADCDKTQQVNPKKVTEFWEALTKVVDAASVRLATVGGLSDELQNMKDRLHRDASVRGRQGVLDDLFKIFVALKSAVCATTDPLIFVRDADGNVTAQSWKPDARRARPSPREVSVPLQNVWKDYRENERGPTPAADPGRVWDDEDGGMEDDEPLLRPPRRGTGASRQDVGEDTPPDPSGRRRRILEDVGLDEEAPSEPTVRSGEDEAPLHGFERDERSEEPASRSGEDNAPGFERDERPEEPEPAGQAPVQHPEGEELLRAVESNGKEGYGPLDGLRMDSDGEPSRDGNYERLASDDDDSSESDSDEERPRMVVTGPGRERGWLICCLGDMVAAAILYASAQQNVVFFVTDIPARDFEAFDHSDCVFQVISPGKAATELPDWAWVTGNILFTGPKSMFYAVRKKLLATKLLSPPLYPKVSFLLCGPDADDQGLRLDLNAVI
jgi:hypothetical protein